MLAYYAYIIIGLNADRKYLVTLSYINVNDQRNISHHDCNLPHFTLDLQVIHRTYLNLNPTLYRYVMYVCVLGIGTMMEYT